MHILYCKVTGENFKHFDPYLLSDVISHINIFSESYVTMLKKMRFSPPLKSMWNSKQGKDYLGVKLPELTAHALVQSTQPEYLKVHAISLNFWQDGRERNRII